MRLYGDDTFSTEHRLRVGRVVPIVEDPYTAAADEVRIVLGDEPLRAVPLNSPCIGIEDEQRIT